jgi:hypothetical protein
MAMERLFPSDHVVPDANVVSNVGFATMAYPAFGFRTLKKANVLVAPLGPFKKEAL